MGASRVVAPRNDCIDECPADWLAAASWAIVAEETAGWSESDWERLRFACQVHGLAPELAARLGPLQQAREDLAAFGDWLALCLRLNVERTAKLRSRLREVLLACQSAEIAVMALKGAAIRERFGTDATLRPTCDIDLLVAPEDQERFGQAVADVGYHLEHINWRHYSYHHEGDRTADSPLGEDPEHPICLEAHGRVRVRRAVLIEVDLTPRFWEQAVEGQVEGVSGPLSTADALLEHLLLNHASDLVAARGRAVQALDLAPVAATLDDAAWRRLADSLAERGALPWAWLSVTMARRLQPLTLPAMIEERLTQGTSPAFRAVAERVSWSEVSACRTYRAVELSAWRWAVRPSQRARVACSFVRRAVRGRLARFGRPSA